MTESREDEEDLPEEHINISTPNSTLTNDSVARKEQSGGNLKKLHCCRRVEKEALYSGSNMRPFAQKCGRAQPISCFLTSQVSTSIFDRPLSMDGWLVYVKYYRFQMDK